MNRSAGTGMMVFGLVLIVLGAILDFAVNVTASGFNINTIGLILLIVGIVAFLAGLVVVMTASSRRSVHRRRTSARYPAASSGSWSSATTWPRSRSSGRR